MGATFAPIAALLLSAAILLMGNGLQSTLLPLRAEMEAFSTFNIGVLGSTYYKVEELDGRRPARAFDHIGEHRDVSVPRLLA